MKNCTGIIFFLIVISYGAAAAEELPLTARERVFFDALVREYGEYSFAIVRPDSGAVVTMYQEEIITSRVYTPGSLIKPFSIIAASAETGTLDTSYRYVCKGYDEPVMKCWLGRGHGELGLVEALANSCNAYIYNYLRHAPFDEKIFRNTLNTYGFIYHATGEEDIWSKGVGFGNSVRAYPLDMLYSYCALYNGGLLYRSDGSCRTITLPPQAVLDLIFDSLRGAYIYGTGHIIHKNTRYTDVACKTGTGVAISGGRENPYQFTGVVVAFYPSVDPEIGMIVVVDKGRSSTAGQLAALVINHLWAERLF